MLLIAARQMDVDVLLWGGTHRFEAYEMEGRFFVNPGSATGALGTGWWADGEEPVPSFVLMDVSVFQSCISYVKVFLSSQLANPPLHSVLLDHNADRRLHLHQVQGNDLVVYVYQLKKDDEGEENVSVEKVSFHKNVGGSS